MGALARAGHPALYDRHWHPTALCGGVGAAVAAARAARRAAARTPSRSRCSRASGLRAAFGSHGKSLQVGLAASSGVEAARLGGSGRARPARARPRAATRTPPAARSPSPTRTGSPSTENWIKAWPCCLQTHGAIEAAAGIREARAERLSVTVHPVSLQAAAHGPEPKDGLEAKFSIPYLTAFTLLHGPPRVESFDAVDAAGRRAGAADRGARPTTSLLESEFVLTTAAASSRA